MLICLLLAEGIYDSDMRHLRLLAIEACNVQCNSAEKISMDCERAAALWSYKLGIFSEIYNYGGKDNNLMKNY